MLLFHPAAMASLLIRGAAAGARRSANGTRAILGQQRASVWYLPISSAQRKEDEVLLGDIDRKNSLVLQDSSGKSRILMLNRPEVLLLLLALQPGCSTSCCAPGIERAESAAAEGAAPLVPPGRRACCTHRAGCLLMRARRAVTAQMEDNEQSTATVIVGRNLQVRPASPACLLPAGWLPAHRGLPIAFALVLRRRRCVQGATSSSSTTLQRIPRPATAPCTSSTRSTA